MDFICFMNIFYKYGKRLLEDMLVDIGLNMQALIVILVIDASEGISQSHLINFTGLDKGNFSKFLKNLEIKKYIYREESQQLPGHNSCYLTSQGKEIVPDLKNILTEWQNRITAELSSDELNSFNAISADISKNLFKELDIRW
ncbi:winged helix-turn-helix transcriptional regulator [Aerococcaceae bacterium DSM 111020]|nr:winged helix-turn-helix transcriptional regulator [Aerococcaceae bacterium DSM 111020]